LFSPPPPTSNQAHALIPHPHVLNLWISNSGNRLYEMMTLIQHPHVLISRINTSENPIYEMINAINFPLNYPCTIVCRAPSFRSSPKTIQSNQLKPMLQQRSVGAGGDGSWTSVESVYKAAEERLDGSYCGCRASTSAPAARVSPWGRRCAHGHQP
jgi:hypothetical protein